MTKFLLYEPIHAVGMTVLESVGEVILASATDEDTIIREIGDVDGVIIRSRGAMTRRILEHAPNLQVVGRHGVGIDNIDVPAATDHGVTVVNTPLATVESVAEHAVGLMLALSKQIVFADQRLRQGQFEIRNDILGREMMGRTLGVIGFGRIGKRVAQICHHAFGMRILYSDIQPDPKLEAELEAVLLPMAELLGQSEYVTVHVPLLPDTKTLIGPNEFSLMRLNTLFINTSRGPVVDEQALYQALVNKQILGAAIDVFDEEPTPADNPLFALDNVIVTPHIASSTEEAMKAMALVAEDVAAVVSGREPRFPVNEV